MKMFMRAAFLAAAALWSCPALAQSGCPSIVNGAVLTAAQWNACFSAKQNLLGYTPINKAGDTMLGPLLTAPSITTASGFNIAPGVAPTLPNNGDMWMTTAGLFAQVNGTTVGPFAPATSSGFAATLPVAVSFPSGIVTYALNFNSSLALDGSSNLGINLAHSNTFTAAQTFNLNAASAPAGDTGTILQIVGVDAAPARLEATAFGATANTSLRAAGGTGASPIALSGGTTIGEYNWRGWDGSAWSAAQAHVAGLAASNWTPTSHPTRLMFGTTAVGSTAISDSWTIENDGGLYSVGVTGGSKGFGNINAAGIWINGTAVVAGGCPNATTSALGCVEGDGATLTLSAGVISLNRSNNNTWPGIQTFTKNGFVLKGLTSGSLAINCADVCGSNTLTLPAGTTNFSATGGANQVVQQTSAGGAFTVGQLAASALSNGTTGTGAVVLATSPSIAGLTVTGSFTATGLVTVADLASPTTTVAGQACTLGSSCNIAVTNLTNIGAATIVANSASGSGSPSALTIQGLTDISTPNTTLDWLLIFNHTTGTLQKTTAAELVSAVSSGVTAWTASTGLFGSGTTGTITAASTDIFPGGLQINGSMEVSQFNVTNSVTLTATGSLVATYILDQWQTYARGTFVAAAVQSTDAPPGYANSLKITVSTAEASLGINDELSVCQPVIASRVTRLNEGSASAQPLSIGFWTKIHQTGLFSGALKNLPIGTSTNARGYPFTYTQAVADTWQYNTATIPGDTTGTWTNSGTSLGLEICFNVAAGTNRLSTASTWFPGDVSGANSSTNGVAATSSVFALTGVIAMPGSYVPSSADAPYVMRIFTQELLAAQYYWFKTFNYGTVPAQNAGMNTGEFEFPALVAGSAANRIPFTYPSQTRTTPSFTWFSPGSATANIYDESLPGDGGPPSIVHASDRRLRFNAAGNSSTAVSNSLGVHVVGDARL